MLSWHPEERFLMAMLMNDVEIEVALLEAIYGLINNVVNFEVMELLGEDPHSEIRFRTMTHQQFFNIALVDFLSCTDKRAFKTTSYLGGLKSICEQPSFTVDDSVRSLREASHAFTEWLDTEIEVDPHLVSVPAGTTVKLARVTFLKMCGNIAKHNVLRSVGVAEDLQEILDKSGIALSLDEALLALADFYDRFHTDILNYHGSAIAAFLNDIRWGVYEYLQPEFHRSMVWESRDPPKYRYTYPEDVTTVFGRACYWDLMNDVRDLPYMRRFQVGKYLKLRY
jgi:hypothetical protein